MDELELLKKDWVKSDDRFEKNQLPKYIPCYLKNRLTL